MWYNDRYLIFHVLGGNRLDCRIIRTHSCSMLHIKNAIEYVSSCALEFKLKDCGRLYSKSDMI